LHFASFLRYGGKISPTAQKKSYGFLKPMVLFFTTAEKSVIMKTDKAKLPISEHYKTMRLGRFAPRRFFCKEKEHAAKKRFAGFN
jgi:hypothetical protein